MLEILFLQVELCDDQSGNNAYDVLNNSSDINTGSHLPAVKEVINFMQCYASVVYAVDLCPSVCHKSLPYQNSCI